MATALLSTRSLKGALSAALAEQEDNRKRIEALAAASRERKRRQEESERIARKAQKAKDEQFFALLAVARRGLENVIALWAEPLVQELILARAALGRPTPTYSAERYGGYAWEEFAYKEEIRTADNRFEIKAGVWLLTDRIEMGVREIEFHLCGYDWYTPQAWTHKIPLPLTGDLSVDWLAQLALTRMEEGRWDHQQVDECVLEKTPATNELFKELEHTNAFMAASRTQKKHAWLPNMALMRFFIDASDPKKLARHLGATMKRIERAENRERLKENHPALLRG